MLEIRLLGTFEVKQGKNAIAISSRPAQSLFAFLILSVGTAHRREKLAGMLWPDSLEETARDNLRHALWRIRKALPTKPKIEYLLADDLTITFNASAEYWLDASALNKASEDASPDELISVLSAYQGELLPGFYDEWVMLEREHVNSIFENKMTRLMSLLQEEKRWTDILDWAERWIKLGQKPEPAYRALMSAHAAKGDMSKVAATYERCVKSLGELKIEPSEQTKALFDHLKSGTPVQSQIVNSNLPSGTVTFLFTDIEGSTKLARDHPKTWETLRARHNDILKRAIASNSGYVFALSGDAFCAAFNRSGDALNAAYLAQKELQSEPWGESAIRVRMGIHTGEAEAKDNEYQGYVTLALVQRLMSAGHGGQILVSGATENLVRNLMQKEINLQDMGRHNFKDVLQAVPVFQMIAPGLQEEFPPLRTLDILPNNSPLELTSFVGREIEIAEVRQLLANTRLLTLTGPGGTGKTRLSIRVAAEVLDTFPDGVWFVELADLSDPALVSQAVTSVLNIREQSGRPLVDTLTDYLRTKTLLLILDNCEHLIDACAQLVTALLRACPKLKTLSSSREALGVAGEMIYRVPSLSIPDASSLALGNLLQYESARLFIERAQAAESHFVLTTQNIKAITQICQRLDGMPLAIELAAARIRMMSVGEIAAHLDDRFDLLTAGSRTALPRHQTLHAAIDWSYELLSGPEQIFFSRLSVFAGGFTLDAAEEIAAGVDVSKSQVIDLLGQLINKSLVMVGTRSENSESETRYGMLETIREYAREKLEESGETEGLRGQHASFFTNLAALAGPELRGPNQQFWFERLDKDNDNFRSVLAWSLENDVEIGAQLAGNLFWFWQTYCYWSEGRDWYDRLLKYSAIRQPLSKIVRAQVLCEAGWLALAEMDTNQAKILSEDGLALYRETNNNAGIAMALNTLGWVEYYVSNYPKARSLAGESLTLFREIGNKSRIADDFNLLGNIARAQGEYKMAMEFYKESLLLSREISDKPAMAYSLSVWGYLAWHQGDLEQARILSEESLQLGQEVRLDWSTAETLNQLGDIALAQGEYEKASSFYDECEAIWARLGNPREIGYLSWSQGWLARLQGNYRQASKFFKQGLLLWQEVQDKRHIAECLEGLAGVALALGHVERAVRLFGATEMIREVTESPLSPVERANYGHDIAALRTQLSKTNLINLWAEGRAMTLEQAIELALEKN